MLDRAVRLVLCIAIASVVPITFLRSLLQPKPMLAAGVSLRDQLTPHARTGAVLGAPVQTAAAAPRPRRGVRRPVPAASPAPAEQHAVLVTYVPHTAPSAHRAGTPATAVRRARPAAPRGAEPKPRARPTPSPAPAPAPPPTVPPTPAETPTPASPPPTPPQAPTPPPAPDTPTLPPVEASRETRPGNGYGDKNHTHTGPPGR